MRIKKKSDIWNKNMEQSPQQETCLTSMGLNKLAGKVRFGNVGLELQMGFGFGIIKKIQYPNGQYWGTMTKDAYLEIVV
jgi:hypothetical protein